MVFIRIIVMFLPLMAALYRTRDFMVPLLLNPKTPRQNMTEMVMMMNGYDLDYEKEGIGPSRIPTPQEFEEDYMPQEFEHGNEV